MGIPDCCSTGKVRCETEEHDKPSVEVTGAEEPCSYVVHEANVPTSNNFGVGPSRDRRKVATFESKPLSKS